MKRLLWALFFLPSLSLALNCGNLGIAIKNITSDSCTLIGQNFLNGNLDVGSIPTQIASNTTSQMFYIKQDNNGSQLALIYNCGNRKVRFGSFQGYSTYYAQPIEGYVNYWNGLTAKPTPHYGSCWIGRPGQIIWEIS